MRAVVLALTVALVASQQINFVPEFIPGKTYVFRYDALALAGIPENGLARAGVKVVSKVYISALKENTFFMKLVNPEIFEYNDVWPKDAFVPATKLVAALSAQLQIPIKFEYTNGVVGKVFAPAGVSATVLNLHRGILNILQLNLKKTQTVYEMQEIGAQGMCKTHYFIAQKGEHISVTKSKDLTNCQERIMKDMGLAYLEKCVECQQRVKSLSGTATYSYTMKPTASGVQISEAVVEELHQFAPFNAINGAAQMMTKQTFVFEKFENAPIVPVAGDYVAHGTLLYEFATELLQTPIQLLRISNAQAQIVEILQHLVAHNMDEVHDDAPLKFVQFIQLLRVATYENLGAIWAQFKDKPFHRRWILDAIPAVGNAVAFRLVKENFVAGEFTTAEFAQVLLAAVHMANADMGIVKMYSELALHPKVQELPVLREAAMLGYGTLIAKYCAAFPTCTAEIMKPIHDSASDAIAKRDIARITLLLKVMGNAGHPASLKPIMKLLPGFGAAAASFPMRLHIDAILALRNIAKAEPRMVQPVALQLFMDKSFHPEVRMVAYVVLFETKPSMALIATIIGALRKEDNMQILSFTYSHMKFLTRSTAPDFAPVAAACNVAIRLLSPRLDRMSLRLSQAVHLDHYFTPYMVGAAASAFFINDAATILPRAVVAKARAYIAGAAADVLEVGVRADGLQEAMLKSDMVDSSADRVTKMRHVLKALTQWRALPNSEPLGSIYFKFFGQEVAFANIDKAIVDQALAFAPGSRATELLRTALMELQSGINLRYAKPLLAAEVRRIFPTAVGVPMELSTYTAAVITASGRVHAVIKPALPESLTVANLLKTDVMMDVEIKPGFAMQTFAVMGVNTAFIQAAVMASGNVHVIVPAKVIARADIANYNFKIEALPVVTPEHIATVRYETLAVVRNIEDLPAERIMPIIPTVEIGEHQISRERFTSRSIAGGLSRSSEILYADSPLGVDPKARAAAPIHNVFCAVVPYVGIKACVDASTSNTRIYRNLPYLNLFGQHTVFLSMQPAEGPAVERVEFEVQIGPAAAVKLVKDMNMSDEQMYAGQSILSKLSKILEAGLRNYTTSSSSSSRSSMSSSVSSSMSSSSSQMDAAPAKYVAFKKFHKNQHLNSPGVSRAVSSGSRAASMEAIWSKAKMLGNVVEPFAAAFFRIVRVDSKILGFQFAGYLDKANHRTQLTMSPIPGREDWKMCVDGALLSKHKVSAQVAWGAECQEVAAAMKAETGLFGADPAVRLEVDWMPLTVGVYAKRIAEYIPGVALVYGISVRKVKNSERQCELTMALSNERTVDFRLRTPEMTIYKSGVILPFIPPIGRDGTVQKDIYASIQNMLYAASSAQCKITKDTMTTFNNKKYKRDIPLACYQVLAQDCTPELKFMVLMRKDERSAENHLNVKIADIDIDLYPKGDEAAVKVNGMEINDIKYNHPTGSLQIKKRAGGIVLSAPTQGLQEVFYSKDEMKIMVVDWMRGKTCGLCGMADGEIRQEYRTPSGYVTKSPVSFAHSWVLPAENCEDPNQCRMRLESVKLEKQMMMGGQESKCYSVEPVLRCLPGCYPIRTTIVSVGYHCVPIDSDMNQSERSIYGKSVDLTEATEAHVACSCTDQCA